MKHVEGEPWQPRGTCTFAYHDNITIVWWTGTKIVYVISTSDSDELVTVKRRVDSTKSDVPCSLIISNYNSFMGGVDLVDQVMCYYSIGRKTMKCVEYFEGFWIMELQMLTLFTKQTIQHHWIK